MGTSGPDSEGGVVDLCTANVVTDCLFGLYKAAMSLKETVVSLKLQSGKRFDDILIKDTECSLAEFLDDTLKELEVNETGKVLRGLVYLLIKVHPRT